jgi:CheY-like chemotaxis protein
MKKMVLIIDDDEAMRDVLADRIESMGFGFELAESQHAATELLRKRRYDLILLDQELPVRKGKPTNKQVGRNLLTHIREDALNQKTPVIIVTAHDGNDPMLACDFMHNGADYFLPKPSIEMLEEKIKLAFERRSQKGTKSACNPSPKLNPFPGGNLEFQTDGLFLGEIRVATPSTNIGRILRELAKQAASSKRRGCSSNALADRLGLPRGSQAIAEAVSSFRQQVVQLLNEAGYTADMHTVITKGTSGYELAQNIDVTVESMANVAEPKTDPTSQERMAWLVEEAEAGRKPCKSLYSKRFGLSQSTWKRDLRLITGRLKVIGTGPTAYYIPK